MLFEKYPVIKNELMMIRYPDWKVMNIKEIVKLMIEKPYLIEMGKGKLSKRFFNTCSDLRLENSSLIPRFLHILQLQILC